MSSPQSSKPLILARKGSPAAVSPQSDPIKLNISKNYVLPPRPKPGRKPSVEAPPNRRKAQNREAQRAFRERRAVAIQELERKLGMEAQKHAQEQNQLKDMIAKLMSENATLKQMHTPPSMSPGGSALSPMSPMVMSPNAISPGAHATPNFYMSPVAVCDPEMDILNKVLDEKLPVPSTPKPPTSYGFARSPSIGKSPGKSPGLWKLSPKEPPACGLKLAETNWEYPAVPLRRRLSSLETDFTFSFKNSPSSRQLFKRPEDRCGFCTDNTPCVCLETAMRERGRDSMRDIESPVSSAASTPLPAQVQSPNNRKNDECTGDPGTCTQCQDDPMSTLFCTTVAAKPKPPISGPTATNTSSGTFIPAKAAYRTLSRHKQFSACDFSHLVDSLHTNGTQVEVNSVAKVLRMLDRKLYD